MSFVSKLYRHGEVCTVKKEVNSGTDAFGNPESNPVVDREVIAFRTYPNRNTEINASSGNRERDNPVFLVPKGPNQPEPPSEDEIIVYNDTDYKVNAITPYDSHIEFIADPIIH